jgi:hypothetical protein
METLFPVYPTDIKMINSNIGVSTIKGTVVYFNGGGPIYQHGEGDYQSFRFITSQMIDLKTVHTVEIIECFAVSKESVVRWSKIYRTKGAKGFFGTKKFEKRGNVLTEEVLIEVQGYLNAGLSLKAIGDTLSIKTDTLQKAIQQGRLTRAEKQTIVSSQGKTQSERSREDIVAPIGVGCTNELGRIVSAIKKK